MRVVAVLLTGLLVACGGGGGSKNSASSQQNSTSSTPTSISSLASSSNSSSVSTSDSSSIVSSLANSSSSTVVIAANQSATETLGSEGGNLILTTSEGAIFTLQIPAGALNESTPIRIETASTSASQRFHLRFSPALVFLNGEKANLQITLPSAMALPDNSLLGYDGVPIAYTQNEDGSFNVELSYFANTETPIVSRNVTQKTQITARSLDNNCGGVPELDLEAGGLTASVAVEIEIYGQCMVGAVNALATSGDYEDAAKLASATAAFLQSVGVGDATVFINQASNNACTAYRNVLDAAINTSVDLMGKLNDLVRPILFWETSIQQLGVTCTNVGATEYTTVIENKTNEAIQHYNNQKNSITNVNDSNYTDAVEEARENQTTVTQVKSLQPPTAVDNLLDSQITDTTQSALLDAILQAPWQHCRDTGNYDELIELMMIMNSPESVKNAAQYCGTQLTGQSFDNTNTQIATLPTLGGISSTNSVTTGSLRIRKDGSFTLLGPIRALQCPTLINGSEELEIRLNSQLVQTISSAPYLNVNLQLNVAEILSAAGLDATTFSTGTLSILRTGDACGGFWGNSPQPLVSINLSTGLCTPAQGEHFCVTPIEIDEKPGFYVPRAHTEAGVVLEHVGGNCREESGISCGVIWHPHKPLVELPPAFTPTGMSNSGTVIGNHLTNWHETSSRFLTQNISVMPSDADQPTILATVRDEFREPIDGTWSNSYNYFNPIISPAGRITYTEHERNTRIPVEDLGYCDYYGNVLQCSRIRTFSINQIGDTPQVVHTANQLPVAQPAFHWMGDLEPIGRYGRTENGPALNFIAIQNSPWTTVYAADEDGNLLIGSYPVPSSFTLLPPQAWLPQDWHYRSLGPKGHVLLISSDSGQVRLANLKTQLLGSSMPANQSVVIPGGTLEFDLSVLWTVMFDSKGRIAINASSTARPNIRAAILTPEGVELP